MPSRRAGDVDHPHDAYEVRGRPTRPPPSSRPRRDALETLATLLGPDVDYHYGVMQKAEVRRWLAAFDAVAARDREEARRTGPRRERSIRIAASMIDAVRRDPFRRRSLARLRQEDERATREAWRKLRETGRR